MHNFDIFTTTPVNVKKFIILWIKLYEFLKDLLKL
jgi:hypothetical protein